MNCVQLDGYDGQQQAEKDERMKLLTNLRIIISCNLHYRDTIENAFRINCTSKAAIPPC